MSAVTTKNQLLYMNISLTNIKNFFLPFPSALFIL